jgi:hypothetical protein
MLKDIKEGMFAINGNIRNLSRETETLKKNDLDILELKNTILENVKKILTEFRG